MKFRERYQEYLKFKEKNPDFAEVQMDSVIGTKSGKGLLNVLDEVLGSTLFFGRSWTLHQVLKNSFNPEYKRK